jgi:D-3-phosphoglycerate dehydrogenase
MYRVLVADSISDKGLKALEEHPQFLMDKIPHIDPKELAKIIDQYDVLIIRSRITVTEELLENSQRLRLIARAGVGVDNIDIAAATRKGIIVINSPGANTIAAAEHTFAMMLSLARKIPQAHSSMQINKWERSQFQGVELYDKSIGIIGMGKIGIEVAKRAKAFQMNVLGFDPFLTEERAKNLGIKKASLDEIAHLSDFITIHTPLTKETKSLIDRSYLEKVKRGVRIINCARGGIVNEEALLEGLESGIVAGAALDVFEQEPPGTHLKHPNLIVTPHLGASTKEAQEKVAKEISEEVIDILEYDSIRNAINMPDISLENQQTMKPFLQLSEQIAQIAIQFFIEAPERIEVFYHGEIADNDTEVLSRTMIKGILSYHLSDTVNLVNAHHLLKENGLSFAVQRNASKVGFTNYIELKLSNRHHSVSIGGTLLDGIGSRIVKINEYQIDVRPEQNLLYIKHQDIPGVIGRVGSVIGDHHINIGTMQVGRSEIGGEAIMVLTLDKAANDEVLAALKEAAAIKDVKLLGLSTGYSFFNRANWIQV